MGLFSKVAKAFDEYLANSTEDDFVYFYLNHMPDKTSDKTKVDNYKELIPLTGLSMHAFNFKGKHNAEIKEKYNTDIYAFK